MFESYTVSAREQGVHLSFSRRLGAVNWSGPTMTSHVMNSVQVPRPAVGCGALSAGALVVRRGLVWKINHRFAEHLLLTRGERVMLSPHEEVAELFWPVSVVRDTEGNQHKVVLQVGRYLACRDLRTGTVSLRNQMKMLPSEPRGRPFSRRALPELTPAAQFNQRGTYPCVRKEVLDDK